VAPLLFAEGRRRSDYCCERALLIRLLLVAIISCAERQRHFGHWRTQGFGDLDQQRRWAVGAWRAKDLY